jgi:limonene-1,2-epoxide hydrolase
MIDSHDKAIDGQFAPDGTPNPYWWQRLFSTIDGADGAGFVEFLTADAQFRFGNAPSVQGSSAILAAVSGFFASIRTSQHQLLDSWSAPESVGCEGEVTYTRHDGSVVSYPFANVFKLRGEKIASYRIYIDVSTLFSPPA